MQILNLTQHVGTPEQGVREPKDKEAVRELLTFTENPWPNEIRERARKLADLAAEEKITQVMIDGAPCLMAVLEFELIKRDMNPVFAFSERQVIETVNDDGTVIKKSEFKHAGFTESVMPGICFDIFYKWR